MTQSSQPLAVWFAVWDVAALGSAWVLAYAARFATGWKPVNNHQPDFALCLANLPLVTVAGLVAFRLAGSYDVHRLRRFREELWATARAVGLLVLVVMSTNFARQYEYESRGAMGLFGVFALGLVLACRRLTWTVIGRLRARGYNQSHALIVGTGRLARRTARALEESAWVGIRTVAYVADHAPAGNHFDRPVLGPIADLPRLVAEHHIEHVFVALPLHQYGDARRVFDALSETVVDVRLVADVPALSSQSLTTSTLQGMTLVGLRESPHHGLNVGVKRAMDIALSAVALVPGLPLMALVAAAVRLTSPGPILYRQERCSLNGRPFWMLKFRTMRIDAEAGGAQMTAADDPRRTPVGGFLRRTNLDELPQLFNVLRGEMSLVGPRPERPVFVDRFKKSIPNYMARHAVKCGMTGWAQVNGWRGNSSLRKRVQYDLYYITHWNPLFDLRIMVLTVWRMLFDRQKHAY
jgi:Undecaprenyl-phosphate glucose phosphotransferase